MSIFTYGMKKGVERLAAANVKNVSLTNLDAIARVRRRRSDYISPRRMSRGCMAFRDNPADESWIKEEQLI